MCLQQAERHLLLGAPLVADRDLRQEWGFEGLVVSDWGAVHDRVAALRGGLDLEMPPNLGVSAIVAAVRDGSLDESILDESVSRVLHLVDRSQPALAEVPRSVR